MILITNRQAKVNYDILETFEAGLDLTGAEVKSLRRRQGSLAGARVAIDEEQAFLLGAQIPPYQPQNQPGYQPDRPRRLLLKKEEIRSLIGQSRTRRLTLIPLSVYNKRRYLKLTVALARGKRKYDKRASIKKRDTERDLGRSLKK
jgi:SsrA-binding protein